MLDESKRWAEGKRWESSKVKSNGVGTEWIAAKNQRP